MTNYTWNGDAGDYLDPAQWTPSDVPLYGAGDVATIDAGTATLRDAAPNNLTLVLGVNPDLARANPILVLSNAALGPDLTLDTMGNATLGVDGYDTNYGTINVATLDSVGFPRSISLTIALEAGSQLNQEGTIAALSLQTVGYASLAFNGPGTLNNDGQIVFGPGSTGNFGFKPAFPQVTGSGTITVDHADVTMYIAASTQTVDLLGGTLTTFGGLEATIKDWNDDGRVAVGPSVQSFQFNQTSDGGGDLQLFGDNKQQIGDLNLLSSYATSDFSLNQKDSGGIEVISVSGHAPPSA